MTRAGHSPSPRCAAACLWLSIQSALIIDTVIGALATGEAGRPRQETNGVPGHTAWPSRLRRNRGTHQPSHSFLGRDARQSTAGPQALATAETDELCRA